MQAEDPQALAAATEQVRGAVAGTPDVADVTTDLANSLAPHRRHREPGRGGRKVGLSEASIGADRRGRVPRRAAGPGHPRRYAARPWCCASAPRRPQWTRSRRCRCRPRPGIVPLSRVATVSQVDGPASDEPHRRPPQRRPSAAPRPATTSAPPRPTLTTRLKALKLPAGASYTLGGVSADQADAFGDLGLALLAAIAIVFLVMAATFRSLVQPLILLVSIPFAAHRRDPRCCS